MKIIIIAAMDKNGLIGNDNRLPWHFPEDLKHFKETTTGKFVIMGKNTYKSIGKPLKKRKVIVLSRSNDFNPPDARGATSIDEALSLAEGEIFVAGGAGVYRQFLSKADLMYITEIDDIFEGDIYFPEFNKEDWEKIEEKKGENKLLTFKKLKRKNEKHN